MVTRIEYLLSELHFTLQNYNIILIFHCPSKTWTIRGMECILFKAKHIFLLFLLWIFKREHDFHDSDLFKNLCQASKCLGFCCSTPYSLSSGLILGSSTYIQKMVHNKDWKVVLKVEQINQYTNPEKPSKKTNKIKTGSSILWKHTLCTYMLKKPLVQCC